MRVMTQFLVMPFGLTNAPTTFHGLMNTVFKQHLRKFILVFFDDIFIYSLNIQEHLHHLDVVFATMKENSLLTKRSKFSFGGEQIEYLGYIISGQGVSTDPVKIETVRNWPKPTTIKQLRGFLGLTGYYPKFVRNYGSISKPLPALLKKTFFKWTNEVEQAFSILKIAMTSTLVLAFSDMSDTFVVETNASDYGIGVILMQKGHPADFISKALTPKQQVLPVYEKELLVVLLAIKKCHFYLINRNFIIKTDHRSLKYLVEQNVSTPFQHTWLTKLLGFDYEIHYKKRV